MADSEEQAGAALLADLVLREIRIRNYRAIEDLWLPLGSMTLLVGENNAGKTSVLDAIGIALGRRGAPDDLRVAPDGQRALEFVIDVRIEPEGALEFDDTLAAWVTTAVRIPEDDTEPQYLALRVIGRHNALQGRIDDARSFLSRWQREDGDGAEPDLLERPPVPQQLRDALLFQFIDARRDVAEELRTRTSFWGRLVGDLDLDQDLAADIFSELERIGERIVSGSVVLSNVRDEIQRSVVALAPTAGTVVLKPVPTVTDNLARSMDVMVSAPESPEISLTRQGMGARSLAVLMIFQAFARRRLGGRTGVPTLSVTAFEEPEAHLHPQATRAVYPLVASVPGQTVLSTHSPQVAAMSQLANARVLRRKGSLISAHWLSESAAQAIHDRSAVSRLVIRRQSDVLFARIVIIVEGETEERMLRPLFEAEAKRTPDQVGVTIVDAEGAQNLAPIALLVESFGGSWIALVDGDQPGVDGVANAAQALERSLDEHSDEIVMLPNGQAIEEYVLEPSLRTTLEAALAARFGDTAVEDYRTLHDGMNAKGGGVRDYQSAGWEERVIGDFLANNKPLWGEAFGQECCVGDPAVVPERIGVLMERVIKLQAT
jgi:putative ATP-dependent endonuclease of OLD family